LDRVIESGIMTQYRRSGGVDLSVVVPCHNEEECINEFHRRMRLVLDELGKTFEVIYINDGSSDRTAENLAGILARDANVVVIDLSRNHGHQLALSAGLDLAAGERVLAIDADLQDPPELLPEMMAVMDAGADVAFAKRISRAGESRFKKISASCFYRLLRGLSQTNLPVDTGDFRLMSKQVVDILRQMPEPHRFLRGMVAWVGFRQVAVNYHRDSRYAGKTKYGMRHMVGLAIDAVTGFATAPLRFMFYLSAMASLAAVGFIAWTVYAFIFLPVEARIAEITGATCGESLSAGQKRQPHGPIVVVGVGVQQSDRLPRSEGQAAPDDGDRERRWGDHRHEMIRTVAGRTVAMNPPIVARQQPIERGHQVRVGPGPQLDDDDAGGRVRH